MMKKLYTCFAVVLLASALVKAEPTISTKTETTRYSAFMQSIAEQCNSCYQILTDMVDAGFMQATVESVRHTAETDRNYFFRTALFGSCPQCYSAIHSKEMRDPKHPMSVEDAKAYFNSDEYRRTQPAQ